jgi:tetratricopeptide (TPR) repeat protein
MIDTVNLFEHLLAQGKRFQSLGQHRTAGQLFHRLTTFRDLPAPVAEEAQARLAELALKRRRYAQARRHLAAALHHQPNLARYHYLMATAMQADARCDLDQAAAYYRRALELAPGHLRCRCDAGLLELRLGRTEEGLALLRQAKEQAPNNPEVVGKLMKGLLLAGQTDEARQVILLARFRNPHQPRFRKLWFDFQVRLLRRQRDTEQVRQDEEGPVLLPFVRLLREPVESDEPGASAANLREDEGAPLPPPHQPRSLRRAGRRHVQ